MAAWMEKAGEMRSKLSADVAAGLREQILSGVAVGKQATQAHG